MDVSSISRIDLSPSVQHRGFGEGEETEPPPAKRRGSLELSGFGALTLNIGGRNTNPVEFVLEGDESELGIACTALGVQLLEAAGSDTFGPSALPEAERRAVDAVLADLGSDEAIVKLLDEPTWVRVYEIVRLDTE